MPASSTVRALGALLLVVSPLLGGCRSSSTNVTGPSSSKCAITLSGSTQVNVNGGTSAIGISTNRECTWTAATQAAWIAVSPTTGQGPATLTVTAQANPDVAARRGAVVVNEARIELEQPAAPCRFSVTPDAANAPAGGGTLTFAVATSATCSWTPSSAVPWLLIQGDPRGTGSGSFTVTVTGNGGAARTGTIDVGGTTVTVSQASGTNPCLFSVTASPSSFPPGGGSGSLAIVASQFSCSWSASPNVAWVSLAGPSSGVGSATIPFTVQANSGGTRAGAIAVANESAAITQTGTSACTFNVSPSSRSIAATGGSETFDVDTAAGCTWNAVSNASWLSISGGASGSGAGRVTFVAAPNQGDARTGTLAIAGSVVSVSQPASSCSYSVVPSSAAFTQAGGTASFNVVTTAGCAWTATSPDAWVTIAGASSGTGSGVVSISASANSSSARTSVLTIAGQPVTVTQTGNACVYTLLPTGQSVTAAGGANTVAVTAPTGCTWTASSNDAWLSITSGATGNGAGVVAYTAGANAGGARTGTLTIAGITFAVSQAAVVPTCTYSLQPSSSSIGAQATAIPVALTTQAGCSWTVASAAAWLSVSGAASGTGSATVTINAGANSATSPRTGTVTIGGQTLTVTQAASTCGFTVSPTTLSPTSVGGPFSVDVTTTSGCVWTAASNASWITIASGASGTGSGTVAVSIAANTDTSPRTGTFTVAGQTVTVTQAAAACAYTLSTTGINAPAAASTASVDLTTAPGCAWVASTNDSWITITSASSGTGSARISFSLLANTTGLSRTGRVLIAGQAVAIVQQP